MSLGLVRPAADENVSAECRTVVSTVPNNWDNCSTLGRFSAAARLKMGLSRLATTIKPQRSGPANRQGLNRAETISPPPEAGNPSGNVGHVWAAKANPQCSKSCLCGSRHGPLFLSPRRRVVSGWGTPRVCRRGPLRRLCVEHPAVRSPSHAGRPDRDGHCGKQTPLVQLATILEGEATRFVSHFLPWRFDYLRPALHRFDVVLRLAARVPDCRGTRRSLGSDQRGRNQLRQLPSGPSDGGAGRTPT